MKNGLYLFLFLGLVLSSCEKDDNAPADNQAELDEQVILDYITDNNLDATKHPSGLYYVINNEGTGSTNPSLFSEVQVEYKGYLPDGTVFDQTQPNNPRIFSLGAVILGWQEGIPVFKKGGDGILLIPSSMGYGSNPPPSIPANSVLIFDVTLHDFN